MGAASSRLNSDGAVSARSDVKGSSRRRRSSSYKVDQMADKMKAVSNLKYEIEKFSGDRSSPDYKEFYKRLTTLACEVQQMRNSKKLEQQSFCDEVLKQIKSCLSKLEEKVKSNEQNKGSLDLGSIESHSFINHNFKEPLFEAASILDRIEQNAQDLEKDIRYAIQLENTGQFMTYKDKIKMLYDDLDLITIENNTLLKERRVRIAKKLIKLERQLKTYTENFERRLQLTRQETDFAGPYISKGEDEFSKMSRHLDNLEYPVLTFKGTRNDKEYNSLEQVLEGYWTKLYSTDVIGEEERRNRSQLVEKINNILQELRNRADENAKEANSIIMQEIEQQLESVKQKVKQFEGSSKDPSYIQLDQELKGLWAKLNDVAEYTEEAKENKKRVINDIQLALKTLFAESKKRDSKIYENNSIIKSLNDVSTTEGKISQMQLLKQVEEFQNHWNQLNYNLDVQQITDLSISTSMLQTLKKVSDGLEKKIKALTIVENKKNNTNVPSNEDNFFKSSYTPLSTSYQSYYQPPDLLQQQVANSKIFKSVETEIKTQPAVKTIGEIQRIGNEAKNLLQQIRQSNCVKDDSDYKAFRAHLEKCKASLESIEYNKKSDTIESNRRRVFKTITEAFRVLETKAPIKIVSEQSLRSFKSQEMMDIDAAIQFYRQQIKDFSSVAKDKQYDRIKQGLSDSLNKLQMLNDANLSKQDSIRQIQQYHQELETKLAENQAKAKMLEHNSQVRRQTSNDVKSIIEQVQKLKSQVERFSGTYNGILYQKIEKNLKDCNDKLDSIDTKCSEKIHTAKIQTKQSIQKYLRILEDKSAKTSAQSSIVEETAQQQTPHQQHPIKQRQSQLDPDSPNHQINALRDKLLKLKDEAELFSGKYRDTQYSHIEKQIFNCFEELKAIDDKGHKFVSISKEQYADYIEKLLEYFEDKSKVNEEQVTQTDSKQIIDPTEELAVLTDRVAQLKNQVGNIQASGDDKQYGGLKQDITACMLQLGKVEAENVAHVRNVKRNLIAELKNCEILLESKVRGNADFLRNQEQLKKIKAVLREVEKISEKVNTFVGAKNDENYCYLDEALIKMTIQLDNIAVYGDSELREARKNAIRDIQKNMNVLSERAAQEEESDDDD